MKTKTKKSFLVFCLLLSVFLLLFSGCGGGGGGVAKCILKGKITLPAGTDAKFAPINDLTTLTVQVGNVTTHPAANGDYIATISPGTNIEITVIAPSGNVLLKAIVPELTKGATVTQDIDTATTAVALIYKDNPSLTIEQIELATNVLPAVETAIVNALTDATEDSIVDNTNISNAVDTAVDTIADNNLPVISSLDANPTTVNTGGSVALSCTATDQDGDTLAYNWTVTGGTLGGTAGSTNDWRAPNTAGTYTITVTVSDGKSGVTKSVTVTVTGVAEYINNARNALFKSMVTDVDFEYAKTQIGTALNIEPNNPDANLLSGVLDIIGEAERIKTDVVYEGGTIFPIYSYTLKRALMPAAETVLSPLTKDKRYSKVKNREPIIKQRKGRLSENPQPSEIQQEVETNVMPVLSGIVTKLEKVLNYVTSNTDWKFAYPKDTTHPELGSYYIDKGDVEAIVSAIYLIRGLTYYGLAYNLDLPENWESGGDANSNGLLEPSEYFPLVPNFGTTRTGGTTYLSNAKADFKKGTELLKKVVDSVISEGNIGEQTLTSKQLQDLEHYKDYFAKLASSFAGQSTSITIPETKECWKMESGCGDGICWAYSYSWDVFDPTYNTSETQGCDFSVSNSAITMNVKFSALFDITNLRNAAPTFEEGGGIVLPYTFGGVFPNGIQKSWFDRNTADWEFDFHLDAQVQGNTIDCTDLWSSSTLTVSGKPFTARQGDAYGLSFYRGWDTLPTLADVITINEMYGTNATLKVPGYNQINITIYSWEWQEITLTPTYAKAGR